MTDSVISPPHYSRWAIEPIEFIRANNLNFVQGNIIKYIMRWDAKDGVIDVDKAIDYLRMLRFDAVNAASGKSVDYRGLMKREAQKQDQQDALISQAEDALYNSVSHYHDDGLGVGDYRG